MSLAFVLNAKRDHTTTYKQFSQLESSSVCNHTSPMFSVGHGGGWILPVTNSKNLETITRQKSSQARTIPPRDMATLV